MSTIKLANLKASDLIALAKGATSVADIDPVVAEFERRITTRTAKANAAASAGKGVQAHASILANANANLATVRAMRDGFAAPAPVATFTATVAPKRTRKAKAPAVNAPALSADELALLRSFLAKLA
ncbi:MAG: hypothetical protein ACO23K_01170 [Ilumatobacteraceae bacterium]|jgi:hypothetical protein